MNKYNNENRIHIFLHIALTIIAIMIVLFNLGRSVVFPIPCVQEFEDNGTAIQVKGKEGTVIVDKSYGRLSFLNKNGKIVKVINGKSLALRWFYRDVVTDGDIFYVLDNQIGSDSVYTRNEHIIGYDVYGNIKKILYSEDYYATGKEQKIYAGQIKKIKICQDGIIAFFWNSENRKMEIHQITDDGIDKVIDKIAIPDQFGTLMNGDYDFSAKKFITYSFSGKKLEHDVNGDRIYQLIDSYIEKIEKASSKEDLESFLGQNPSNKKIPKSAYYTIGFVIEKLVFWIALIYLFILSIVKTINYLKKLILNDKKNEIVEIGFVAIIVILIFGISSFYSNKMQQKNIDLRTSIVSSITYTLAKNPENILIDITKEAFTKSYNQQKSNYVEKYLYNICEHNSINNINIFINLYKKMDNGLIIPIESSFEISGVNIPWAEDKKKLTEIDKEEISNIIYIDDLGECIASVAPLKDNEGKIIGYIETGSDMWLMTVGQFRQIVKTFVALLTLIVSIVLLFSEIKNIINANRKSKLLIENAHPHPEIAYFRSMRLCIEFVLKFDSVLMILIAKDLLIQNGVTNIVLMVGLPATLMSVGMLIGQAISDFCLPRFYVKKVIVISALSNAVIYVVTSFLIFQGSFWGYCLGILLANVFFGVMAGPSLIMPFLSDNENLRFEMNNEKSMAGISASVISIMLAGFVAQYFGNYAIYLFALLPLAGVLFISLKYLPNATYYGRLKSNDNVKKLKIIEYVKFIFSPAILILIFIVIIPSDTIGGYKSIFFPLFSQEYGLTKDFISNLVVLANFTAFILNKPLTNLIKNKNYWDNTIFFLVVSGLIYMSFKMNDTIVWAVIVIVLTVIADKFLIPNINMLWPRECIAKGLPSESYNSIFIYINNISWIIRPTIMGAFLIFGTPDGCIWMGIALIICAILFAVLTSHSAMHIYHEEEK